MKLGTQVKFIDKKYDMISDLQKHLFSAAYYTIDTLKNFKSHKNVSKLKP